MKESVGVRSCHVIEVSHVARPAAKEPRDENQLCDPEEDLVDLVSR